MWTGGAAFENPHRLGGELQRELAVLASANRVQRRPQRSAALSRHPPLWDGVRLSQLATMRHYGSGRGPNSSQRRC